MSAEHAGMVADSLGPSRPSCDMTHECTFPVTHIGSDGYVYCATHAVQRRETGAERTRKMRGWELQLIADGKPLPSYTPGPKPSTTTQRRNDTVKTPDQIAADIVTALDLGEGTEGQPKEPGDLTHAYRSGWLDGDSIPALIAEAIRADRAQQAIVVTEPELAEIAAELVVEQHSIKRAGGESAVAALGWALGSPISYESGLAAFAAAAVRVDRSQLLNPAATQTLIDITYETADGDSNDEEIAALQEARDALASVLARITGPATYTPADTTPLTDDEIAVQASAGIVARYRKAGYTQDEADDFREDAYNAALRALRIARGETVE